MSPARFASLAGCVVAFAALLAFAVIALIGATNSPTPHPYVQGAVIVSIPPSGPVPTNLAYHWGPVVESTP